MLQELQILGKSQNLVSHFLSINECLALGVKNRCQFSGFVQFLLIHYFTKYILQKIGAICLDFLTRPFSKKKKTNKNEQVVFNLLKCPQHILMFSKQNVILRESTLNILKTSELWLSTFCNLSKNHCDKQASKTISFSHGNECSVIRCKIWKIQ